MRRYTPILLLAALVACANAQLKQFSQSVVAGTPRDLMIVRHMIIRGDNVSIGRKLAEIAKKQHHVALSEVVADTWPEQTRWLRRAYPERDSGRPSYRYFLSDFHQARRGGPARGLRWSCERRPSPGHAVTVFPTFE